MTAPRIAAVRAAERVALAAKKEQHDRISGFAGLCNSLPATWVEARTAGKALAQLANDEDNVSWSTAVGVMDAFAVSACASESSSKRSIVDISAAADIWDGWTVALHTYADDALVEDFYGNSAHVCPKGVTKSAQFYLDVIASTLTLAAKDGRTSMEEAAKHLMSACSGPDYLFKRRLSEFKDAREDWRAWFKALSLPQAAALGGNALTRNEERAYQRLIAISRFVVHPDLPNDSDDDVNSNASDNAFMEMPPLTQPDPSSQPPSDDEGSLPELLPPPQPPSPPPKKRPVAVPAMPKPAAPKVASKVVLVPESPEPTKPEPVVAKLANGHVNKPKSIEPPKPPTDDSRKRLSPELVSPVPPTRRRIYESSDEEEPEDAEDPNEDSGSGSEAEEAPEGEEDEASSDMESETPPAPKGKAPTERALEAAQGVQRAVDMRDALSSGGSSLGGLITSQHKKLQADLRRAFKAMSKQPRSCDQVADVYTERLDDLEEDLNAYTTEIGSWIARIRAMRTRLDQARTSEGDRLPRYIVNKLKSAEL
jgi:hypothetical protein